MLASLRDLVCGSQQYVCHRNYDLFHAGKPLSNLQNGQMVKIRQNASGVVTGLTIDTGNNQQVLFTRQPDGSFIRAR